MSLHSDPGRGFRHCHFGQQTRAELSMKYLQIGLGPLCGRQPN